MEQWISDIQEFQKLLKLEVTPREKLEESWSHMKNKRVREFNASNANTNLIIAKGEK